jgi:hypothetical protein
MNKQKKASSLELERRKRKIFFGTKASSKIFETTTMPSMKRNRNGASGINQSQTDDKQTPSGKLTWKDYIMIEPESKKKAIFDVFVLFLVGYSCVTSVFRVAF